MSSTGAQRVKRVADSRGHAAAPPAKSDTPGTSGTRVASGSLAQSETSVKKTTPVKSETSGQSSNPVNSGSAVRNDTATRSGAPIKSATAVETRTAGRSSTPVGSATPIKSNNHVGNFEEAERKVNKIVLGLKKEARESYKTESEKCKKLQCNSKKSKEFRHGGRFLHNRVHIEHQRLFEVAQEAPKGAHLHIHLNACLEPAFLLELAASEELKNNMYISVNLQDADNAQKMRNIRKKAADEAKIKADEEKKKAEAKQQPAPTPAPAPKIKNKYPERLTNDNIHKAKFQFHFLPYGWGTTCSLFDSKYCGRIEATEKAEDKTYDVMKFTQFLRAFDTHIQKESDPKPKDAKDIDVKGYKGHLPKRCMDWLIKRLVFQEGEVEFTEVKEEKAKKAEPAAIARQWAMFNTRTQMMKGLFLAETAYKEYLKALFSSFDKDKIQYAELRPNFMAANSVIRTGINDRKPIKKDAKELGDFSFDYTKTMDNRAIMDMIIGEFKHWRTANPGATFKSMKVIMCTPRSRGYPIKFIEATMEECYKMKQEEKYKKWIAGFDFVGPEFEGRTLEELEPQFTKWKDEYKKVGLKWILHCGESVYDKDTVEKDGKRKDGNLKFALNNLDPHRLAHGYAIQKANLGEKAMAKLQGCCIETCPSSNEILGLAYDARYAAVYSLRSKGIPCSVSCDNPTLFNSTLSHEFYQVMVGKDDFGLKEWKELMMHSIKHSAWNENDADKERVWAEWRAQYKKWVYMVRDKYSDVLKEEPKPSS